VVLDEADRMLDMGFLPDVGRILRQPSAPRQMIMLSATLEQPAMLDLSEQILRDPEMIEVGGPRALAPGVEQRAFLADNAAHKRAMLERILRVVMGEAADVRATGAQGKALVFAVTKLRAEQLGAHLKSAGIPCEVLHGGLPLKTRNQRVHRLNDGRLRVLVATDVAARGLDIDRVTHVINYDMPRSADVYLHRAGRTARAEATGEILSLVEAHDAPMLQRVERYLARAIPRDSLPGLEPTHREPRLKRKKRKPNRLRDKPAKPPPKKERWRDRKNKGKPKGPLGRGKRDR
jgi:ATP-dependent RNA helicase SrmB